MCIGVYDSFIVGIGAFIAAAAFFNHCFSLSVAKIDLRISFKFLRLFSNNVFILPVQMAGFEPSILGS